MNRAVGRAFVDRLMTLAGDAPMPQVRAIATSRLRRIAARLKAVVAPGDAQAAHGQLLQNDIARFLARPYPQAKPGVPPTVPPGAPIGAAWGSVGRGMVRGAHARIVRAVLPAAHHARRRAVVRGRQPIPSGGGTPCSVSASWAAKLAGRVT